MELVQDVHGVRPSHGRQDVGQVSEGLRVAMSSLPQVQDVFGGTGAAGEVVQVSEGETVSNDLHIERGYLM